MADDIQHPSSSTTKEIPTTTSFSKTCFNTINTMLGIGLIAMPYTLAQAGWMGITIIFLFATFSLYTAFKLQRCMEFHNSIKTYSDLLLVVFGAKWKSILSIFLYAELFLIPTGFLIVEGDNLNTLFPNVGFYNFGRRNFFTLTAGLLILPSMFLNLGLLSYISVVSTISNIILIASLIWVGAFDGIGFSSHGNLLKLSGIPVAMSLYSFCYGGHPVFPTLYTSMADKSKFSKMLLVSFIFSTLTYILVAIIRYKMFGENALAQITLNLPVDKLSAKIAIYSILICPIAKYALIITPVSTAIDNLLPNQLNNRAGRIASRCLLLATSISVALLFPYFGLLMALVGVILNVTLSLIVPSLCYLKIFGPQINWGLEYFQLLGIIIMGVAIAVMGTYASIRQAFQPLILENKFVFMM